MEKELTEKLETLETELKGIRAAVERSRWQLFLNGLVYGGGFVLGTAFTIAVAGWVLGAFGMIPGIGDIADTLNDVLEERSGQ